MKKISLKNWSRVFSFTFKNIVTQKTYATVSRLLAILFLLLPAVIMPIVEMSDGEEETVYSCSANEIIVVMSEAFSSPLEERYLLEMAFLDNRFPDMSKQSYKTADTIEQAREAGKENDKSIILYVQKEVGYVFNILLPEGSALTDEDCRNYDEFLSNYYPLLFIPESNMSISQIATLFLPTYHLLDEEDLLELKQAEESEGGAE